MDFKSVSVNNCYILGDVIFENKFFTYFNAKAIYSASVFHLAFFKGNINNVPDKQIKEYEKLSIDLYRLTSPYLYIPFEIDYHENSMYHSYYESDHFPLSVWIEEKSLIPENIFFNIIEDILHGLKTLESTGHSHLLLTPEEILVPLQWKTDSHVKLYNIGLNSIIFTLLNNKEINEYRENYALLKNSPLETKLIKNIKEDIFSFAKIISLILPLCNFHNNTDRISIQNILDSIINKINIFSSIDDILLLFDKYFKEVNRNFDLPGAHIDYSYTDKADFKIPEFNEWKEEAVLEPFVENGISDNTTEADIGISVKKKKGTTFFKSLSSIFSRFFSKKKQKHSVSKTMEEYTNKLLDKNLNNKLINNKENVVSDNSESLDKSIKKDQDPNNNSKRTTKIVENIETSFQNFTENNFNQNIEISSPLISNEIIAEKKSTYSSSTILSTENTERTSINKLIEDFNSSLSERDYVRSYKIIKKSVNSKLTDNSSDIINELENILNNKLQQMDDHYIIDFSSDILSKLIKLDTILPMKIDNYSKKEITLFKEQLKNDSHIIKDLKVKTKDKQNIFLIIIKYLKSQYHKLTK